MTDVHCIDLAIGVTHLVMEILLGELFRASSAVVFYCSHKLPPRLKCLTSTYVLS